MSNPVEPAFIPIGRKINWYEVYILVNHWKSDLEFYKEDIQFLQQLIQKYLIWITKKENMERVNEIRKKEHELQLRCRQLQDSVKDHLGVIVDAIQGKRTVSGEEFRTHHSQMEREYAAFIKDFREIRKEVFKVTEYVIDSEELQHILDS
ncbi:hypothetical protein [Muriicola marianensis]|uniref:Uncharacterized protein n=1 Tax=Muriicola marianensis TaxID=1324801 RepID=A0ABQ1QTS5_9FLAO|nr:hypothetical protein [Muriicola marianensis]GGD43340.1 hypothetical protein GCM10011361_07870 [Muriicola marianensis]